MIIGLTLCLVAAAYAAPATDCPMICPFIYQPVCGSNGKTYSNDCSLNVDSCLYKNLHITRLHHGSCHTTTTQMTTTKKMETTTLDLSCPMICPMNWFPVCGSNGHTYGNDCEMKVDSCLHKTNVIKIHDGACSATAPDQFVVS